MIILHGHGAGGACGRDRSTGCRIRCGLRRFCSAPSCDGTRLLLLVRLRVPTQHEGFRKAPGCCHADLATVVPPVAARCRAFCTALVIVLVGPTMQSLRSATKSSAQQGRRCVCWRRSRASSVRRRWKIQRRPMCWRRCRPRRPAHWLPSKSVAAPAGADDDTSYPAGDLQLRIRNTFSVLEDGLIERGLESRLLVLAALCGEHLLLLGPPGTAKSALSRQLSKALDAPYFERQLTRFSVPEELFGPLCE